MGNYNNPILPYYEVIVLIGYISSILGMVVFFYEFEKVLNGIGGNILFALDEVDYALKEGGDDILYRLSRINNKLEVNVSTIIISNDIRVTDYIKPRTQSTFGRVKIIFSPYTAEELFDILNQRAEFAFKNGVVSEAVIKKISEIESERGGDARKTFCFS